MQQFYKQFSKQWYQLRITQQDLKNRAKIKSFQNFIWKNKISPLLNTQEKDFQVSVV